MVSPHSANRRRFLAEVYLYICLPPWWPHRDFILFAARVPGAIMLQMHTEQAAVNNPHQSSLSDQLASLGIPNNLQLTCARFPVGEDVGNDATSQCACGKQSRHGGFQKQFTVKCCKIGLEFVAMGPKLVVTRGKRRHIQSQQG